jgi:hypothetical protein
VFRHQPEGQASLRLVGPPVTPTASFGGARLTESHLDKAIRQTLEARHAYFTPAWFLRLLGGRLGLGDTFWIGNFGVLLIFVPGFFAIFSILLMAGANPSVIPIVGGLWCLGMAVFYALLTRAVFVAAIRSPQADPWRWIGVAVTAANAVGLGFAAVAPFG